MSSNKKISIILPFVATKPIGGIKIMYQYANELAKRGHSITIYHAVTKFERTSLLPSYFKKLIFKLRRVERPTWFPLHPSIVSKIITRVNKRNVDDADIIFSTWWGIAYLVDKLASSKGKKFNLIQGYEIWKGNVDLVHKSYALKSLHQIVIAKYLMELVASFTGKQPLYLPNAIDTEKFAIRIPPQQRNPASICMLYSEDPIKGSSFGLEALIKAKEKTPELKVELFSIYKNPGNLPDWITFHYKPNDLAEVYNANAMFVSPSLTEGWALPPAEAMACGCAVICTNIGGHQDYAFDGETSLLVKPEDSDDITSKILTLIQDARLRDKLANSGNSYLKKNFSWDRSVIMLEEYFEKC
ncbi:MAG: glycosyltransferase family 4 protein [Bacteroidota bacterium]